MSPHRRNASWFGTVDDFVNPLIESLQPTEGKTVKQQFESNNGRVIGWFNLAYGSSNINKFIELCDKYGFDNIITEIRSKNIKTLGRFEDYLNNKNNTISSDLYHFMLLDNLKNLVKSEEFFLGPWNNLSLTSNKNLIKNCQHCRLNIDYNKLIKDGYSIEQYDSNNGNDGVDSEEEFRVTVKNAKTIPNFLRYIKDVCIFSSDKLFEIYIDSVFGRQNYIDLMDLCKNKNIKIIKE